MGKHFVSKGIQLHAFEWNSLFTSAENPKLPQIRVVGHCELGHRGGFGSHQGRSPEYPCRRKSGAGHSFDWRMRERPQGSKLDFKLTTSQISPKPVVMH